MEIKTSFEFKGMKFQVYSNGNLYSGYRQYVEIRGGTKSTGEWNVESKSWAKTPGDSRFSDAVARACGFIQ